MADSHADVLLIGAGASGGVVARHLTDAGMRVVCLEQGDWPDRSTYPGATVDWEIDAARKWSSVPSVRGREEDYPLDLDSSDMGVVNFNGVGGGTVLYNAQWPRMVPDDFRLRSLHGVADDWPLTYDELRPHYEEIDRQFGVSGLGGNPMYPPGGDPPLPPLPIGEAGLRVARAHAALGWHWWPEPNAILSGDYDGRHRCVQRGTCGSGCNEGAKASTDLTHWPRVVLGGGEVRTGARVTRLVLDRKGRALGAEWIDRAGRTRLQTADVTICAANAIGTARLLLASADRRSPDGVANRSGLVGRRLMLHPLVSIVGLFEDQLAGWQAHSGGLIQCLEFARSDPSRGYIGGTKWALGTAGGPLRAAFGPPDPGGAWGADHHRHVAERLGRTASWIVLVEDLPEEANRVELSATMADSDGLPAPRIVYRIAENSRRNMAFQVDRATESLRAAGAWRVDVTPHAANGHFMGTARMGVDPDASVVDPWGRAHDVGNLLIVDGSVFVTAGAGNPTSTIAALARRAAAHLVANRRHLPVPERSRPVAFDSPVSFDTPVPAPGASRSRRGESSPGGDPLDDHERATVLVAAGALIPTSDPMPDTHIVVERQIDAVLARRPDLHAPLRRALQALPAKFSLADLLEGEGRHPLRYVVAAAYYRDDEVRGCLGYPGTVARPVPSFDFPDYLEEGLLDHLVEPRDGAD